MASRSHLSRGFWDLVAAAEDLPDFLELATLLEVRSFCHFSNFLIAESAGRPVAGIAGYCPGDRDSVTPGQLIALAWAELGWDEPELVEAFLRLETYQTAMPEQAAGLWTIEWVATIPDMRKQGVIRTMFQRVLDEGRDRGHTRAQITTFIGNLPALCAYRRFGFLTAEEKRTAEFESMMGAPGLVRLECDLLSSRPNR